MSSTSPPPLAAATRHAESLVFQPSRQERSQHVFHRPANLRKDLHARGHQGFLERPRDRAADEHLHAEFADSPRSGREVRLFDLRFASADLRISDFAVGAKPSSQAIITRSVYRLPGYVCPHACQ